MESYNLHKKIGSKKGVMYSTTALASLSSSRGDYNKAIKLYEDVIETNKKLDNDKSLYYSMYMNIGTNYKKLGNLKDAKKYYLMGLEVASGLNNAHNLLSSYKKLSDFYEETKDYENALKYYKLAKSKVKEMNVEQARNKELQFSYQRKAVADSVAYEKEKKIKEIEIAKHQIELTVKRNQQYGLYGGLVLVLVFAGVMYNRFKISQKQKNIIEEKEQETNLQKQIIEEKHKEITDSIQYAKRIQSAILPSKKLVDKYLPDSFILYKPKDIVAGDFYWMEAASVILFAAADCTGHGVPGAMVSVVCNNGLNRSVREYGLTDPGKILDKTREIVIAEFEKSEEQVQDGMDIALCSLEGNKLQYAGANNPLWIIRKGSTEVEEIKANKQPIGKFDNPEPYTTHNITLEKGDTIYIFSDGYVDQFGGDKNKKFKAANFKKLLLTIQNETIEKQKELIDQAFEEWKGSLEQIDDVCVIGVRI
ncbi:MAG: SpoIIE family protein phosphatase [Vicingaceae bacterium]|nr:SpoIIE family protein phosphatase [Vicingaceae bacterium]